MTNSAQTIETSKPIKLRWSQQLAAFWSIWWPCFMCAVLLAAIYVRVTDHPMIGALQIVQSVILSLGQGVLLFRLVGKNYRTFWIGVLHQGEPLKRNLGIGENIRIWLQLIWPQIAFSVAVSVFLAWNTNHASAQTLRNLNSLSQWVYVLVVGPAAIRLALYANYPGFRLQAYRRKRKIHPNGEPNASDVGEH